MRGQSAIEFVVLSTFMLLVIAGFFAITTSKMFEARDEVDSKTARDISDLVYGELQIAVSVSDGYTRVFTVPRSVEGADYNITLIDGRELIVVFADKEYIRFMPPGVTGNISKGLNQIKKQNQIINISPIKPQCENGIDDDLDGEIDFFDAGCFSSCDYLGGIYNDYWAEADTCGCSDVPFSECCGAPPGTGSHYTLFDPSCGAGQCWTGC